MKPMLPPPDLQANFTIGKGGGDTRQEGKACVHAHSPHPYPGMSYRAFKNKPGLSFSTILSNKVKIQLTEKPLELCNLQKSQITQRSLIIEGNLGSNFPKMADFIAVLRFGNCRGHFVTWMPFSSWNMTDYTLTEWHRKTPSERWAHHVDFNILGQISLPQTEQLPTKTSAMKWGSIDKINGIPLPAPRHRVLFNSY